MINLLEERVVIKAFIINSLNQFVKKNGSVITMGIYAGPNYGWISVCFNKEKSISHTFENCPDFEFVEYTIYENKEWESTYELPEFSIISHVGQKIKYSGEFGDEEFKLPFYHMLNDLFEKEELIKLPEELFIQMLDSNLSNRIK